MLRFISGRRERLSARDDLSGLADTDSDDTGLAVVGRGVEARAAQLGGAVEDRGHWVVPGVDDREVGEAGTRYRQRDGVTTGVGGRSDARHRGCRGRSRDVTRLS